MNRRQSDPLKICAGYSHDPDPDLCGWEWYETRGRAGDGSEGSGFVYGDADLDHAEVARLVREDTGREGADAIPVQLEIGGRVWLHEGGSWGIR